VKYIIVVILPDRLDNVVQALAEEEMNLTTVSAPRFSSHPACLP
jgi:hypothetical protein